MTAETDADIFVFVEYPDEFYDVEVIVTAADLKRACEAGLVIHDPGLYTQDGKKR